MLKPLFCRHRIEGPDVRLTGVCTANTTPPFCTSPPLAHVSFPDSDSLRLSAAEVARGMKPEPTDGKFFVYIFLSGCYQPSGKEKTGIPRSRCHALRIWRFACAESGLKWGLQTPATVRLRRLLYPSCTPAPVRSIYNTKPLP